jgi:hypothetical protein
VNDCAQNPCEHGSCEDTGNAYACSCDAGWDDKHCDHDKNECIMTQSSADHNCDVAGRCVNTPGSFYCRCVSGFQGDGYTCTDLDDCDPDPCDTDLADPVICRAVGEPTPTGMYNCPPTSFESLGCEDIGANNYQCRTCPGFDGTTLEDIDECDANMDECSASAVCTNNIGSYECECLQGYYDPCVCEDTSKKIGADGTCPVCKIFGTDETCKPGRKCVECTDCKAGPDPVVSLMPARMTSTFLKAAGTSLLTRSSLERNRSTLGAVPAAVSRRSRDLLASTLILNAKISTSA